MNAKMKKKLIPDYSVVTCFIEYKGKVLLLKRAKKDMQFGLWGIPGGKVEVKEKPQDALVRELQEELSLLTTPARLELMKTSPMQNECDGHYLLYLYYLSLDTDPVIKLNPLEHSSYKWTTLQEFKNNPLLFCQGLAFDLVEDDLLYIMKEEQNV